MCNFWHFHSSEQLLCRSLVQGAKEPQVPFCQTAFQLGGPQRILAPEVDLLQVQDLHGPMLNFMRLLNIIYLISYDFSLQNVVLPAKYNIHI